MSATYRLVLKSGANSGQIYPLDGPELTIGREPSSDIVINDPEVSRRHARLFLQGQNYVIEDYGSTNGTSVNGQRLVGPYILRPGEMVTLGENTHLLFEEMFADPNVTRVSAINQPVAAQANHGPVYAAPQPQYEPAQPVGGAYEIPQGEVNYAGQVPAQPPAARPKRKLTPLVIVLIVLVVIGACCLIGFAIFDSLNLYCPMFPGVTNFFVPGYCP